MKKIVLIALSALPICMLSQSSVKKATQHYNNYSYSKVVENLEDKNQANTDAQRRLAESYKILGAYSKAELLYAKITNAPDKKSEDILAYAQILRMNSKYTEAQTQMDMYSSIFENDLRVKLYQSNKTYAVDLLKDKGQFEVKNLSVNSEQQDFGVAFYKDQVVFASSKHDIGAAQRSWNGNNLPYLDLYIGKIDDKSEIISTEKLNKINKKYHEGPSSYSKDGSIVMYTQDNYKSKSTDGIRKLEMIESRFKDGKWGKKINFPLNNKEYSVGHPSLSADGNRLYFSSDMPGGKGGVDIYRVDRKADGTWGSAENLGAEINTEGNEMFPFIHESGLFFFSSDGRPGLGGLDVFVSQITDNQFSKVVNIGAPINGSKDDFTFVLNAEKTKGFFASNREGGKGDDDLYSFNLLKPFQLDKSIGVEAKEELTNSPEPKYSNIGGKLLIGNGNDKSFLNDQVVIIEDKSRNISKRTITDENGDFSFKNVDVAQPLNLILEKNDRIKETDEIYLAQQKGTIISKLDLGKNNNFEYKLLPITMQKLETLEVDDDSLLVMNDLKASKDKTGIIPSDVIAEKTTSLSLYALVTDAKTKNALEGVKITFTDNATGKIVNEFITPASGDYRKTLAENKIGDQLNYTLKLERDGYLTKIANFNYKITQPGEIKIHETLDLAMNKLEVGGDLAKMIDIKPIYFDLGKFNIRKDAAIELDKVVKVMNDYPKMEVELGSHTDCRASAAFNEKLSDNRAKASAEYIKKSITNPERISGKGYGESKLKNGCACEGTVKSTCTEEEHQQNRRTEFIILKTQ